MLPEIYKSTKLQLYWLLVRLRWFKRAVYDTFYSISYTFSRKYLLVFPVTVTALRYFMHFFTSFLKHTHLPPSLRCSTQSQHRGAAGLLNESRRLPRVLRVHTEVCVCVCAWVCVRRVLIEYYDSSPSQIASACHPLSLWHTLHTHSVT